MLTSAERTIGSYFRALRHRAIERGYDLLALSLAVRSDVITLFGVVVFLLPLVDGVLRLRLGAGWEYYIPLVILLVAALVARSTPRYRARLNRYFAYLAVVGLLVFAANVVGLIRMGDVEIDPVLVAQVHSPIARMIVETIRLWASWLVLLLCVTLIDDRGRLRRVLEAFLYGALLQASYGIYEVVTKLFAPGLPLVNPRSIERIHIVRSYGTFFEPSQFGQFMLIALLCFAVYLAIYGDRMERRLVRWRGLVVGLLIMGLVASLSRAAFLVGAGCLLVTLLVHRGDRTLRKTLLFSVVISVLFAGVMVVYWSYRGTAEFEDWIDLFAGQGDYENFAVNRFLAMGEALLGSATVMIRNPLGIGTGMAIFEYSTIGAPFRFTMEYGILLTLIVALLSLHVLHSLWRVRIRAVRGRLVVLFFGIAGILFNYNSVTHAWLWFVGGILLVSPGILRSEPDSGLLS